MRLLKNAAHGDTADGARQLQRGGGDGALTGGDRYGFAGVPLAMEDALHPLLGRHQARLFRRQVDSCFVANAHFGGVISQAVDAQLHAHVIEKNIAGIENGFAEIHDSMRTFPEHPALELAAVEIGIAGTKRGVTLRRNFIFQHGRSGDDFENGAGSELRLNGTIQHGVQRIVVKAFPYLVRNTHRKIVGIGCGAADHGKNFTAARVESNHGARARAQRLFRDLLQVVIDGELNLFTGNSFLGGEAADFFSNAVDDDAAHAVGAHQKIVVLSFQAGFAGEVTGAETAITGFDLLLAYFTDVAAGVGHKSAGKVAAAGDGNHFENGDIGAMRLDESDVRVGRFGVDDNGLKLGQVAGGAEIVSQVLEFDVESIGNCGEIFFYQRGVVAQEQNAE